MNVPMRFSPNKSIWLAAMVSPACVWGPDLATPGLVVLGMGLLISTVLLGHTVGLHRGIIHRAFAFGKGLRVVFAVLFALTGLGGPRAWYRQHALRDHFQSQPVAPATLGFDHGLFTDLWWTLFCVPEVDWDCVPLRIEDDQDPVLLWVDRAFYPLQLAQAVVIAFLAGLSGLVVLWCARNALVIVGHWWVGYLAHTTGSRPYRIDGAAEEGRNLGLLGVLSLGEGFHNNHHAAPRCARIGREWWQVDLGWLTLCVMERLGLVWDVRHPLHAEHFLRPGARLARPDQVGHRRKAKGHALHVGAGDG